MKQRDSVYRATPRKAASTIIVDRPKRTTALHGITGPEIERLGGATQHMLNGCRQWKRGSLWWATTDKGTTRNVIADVQKRITKLQGRHGLPAYSATIFETTPRLHAHMIFVGDDDIAERLMRSVVFGETVKVEPVTDLDGLRREYLIKERTPEANYRRSHLFGGRIKGSHRLEGGGDRVRLSRDLERDAIEAGLVQPWPHTNARRQPAGTRKGYRPRKLTARTLKPAGQITLPLPELVKPVSRLRDFGGGIVPPAVAREIEFRRRRLGLSQHDLAGLIGRSQGQLANAIRAHDPISAPAVNRLREVLVG